MTNLKKEHGYTIIKRNGKVHMDYRYISEEKANSLKALSDKRGWGWTIKEHNEEDLRMFVLINCWSRGLL